MNTHKNTYAWAHNDTHTRQMRYANTLRLKCATAEGQKHSDTHTNRYPHTLLSENTHFNEHTEDICINILSSLNSNANICAGST